MRVGYRTCDVFTHVPFSGNPLAVVPRAEGLSSAQMQAIAAEFGYSETTFVLPPTQPGHDAAVRIFTPVQELGFAGHPNVGTALVLADGDRDLVFEEAAGTVRVSVRDGWAEVAAPQPFAEITAAEPVAVALACGLAPGQLAGTPVVATCGTPFVVAEAVDEAALAGAAPGPPVPGEATGVLLFHSPSSHGGEPIRARMFAPAVGVPEDPATGSAALVLAGLLAAGGTGSWEIRQGVELGRPSLLRVRADGGQTWVSGQAVAMMSGELELFAD